MAILSKRRKENIEGNFYVDSTCIDCETCMILAPEVFKEDGDQSAVYSQPTDASIKTKALQALVSCPTYSIGIVENLPESRMVREGFPVLIEDSVYYNGFHSEKSFGAASYFIKRENGNILVDSPRYAAGLAEKIKSMKRLAEFNFEWVLPGHGRRFNGDYPSMKDSIEKCIHWMENSP